MFCIINQARCRLRGFATWVGNCLFIKSHYIGDPMLSILQGADSDVFGIILCLLSGFPLAWVYGKIPKYQPALRHLLSIVPQANGRLAPHSCSWPSFRSPDGWICLALPATSTQSHQSHRRPSGLPCYVLSCSCLTCRIFIWGCRSGTLTTRRMLMLVLQ